MIGAVTPSGGAVLAIVLALIASVGGGTAVLLRMAFLERPSARREEDRKVRQERDECTERLADCLMSKAELAQEYGITLLGLKGELAKAQRVIEQMGESRDRGR